MRKAFALAGLTALAFGALFPRDAAAASIDETRAAAIEHFLRPYFKPDEPGFAVIVVRDGNTVFREGFGLANVETGVPIRPESVFPLGSITKQFTATAILLLAQEGKLALDDDVRKYLPDYPAGGEMVTIKALLSHTAGVPNFSFHAVRHERMSTVQLIDLFRSKPLDFSPGSRWSYSNSGYDLLGALIERISGMPYASFIERRIFWPLGMTHSHYGFETSAGADGVAGYERMAVGFHRADPVSMDSLFAAGALTSNVDDLARWNAALADDRLLDRKWRDRMFEDTRLRDGIPTGYGYGWVVAKRNDTPRVWHNGSFDGFYAVATRLPADHAYVAILGNVQNPAVPLEYLAESIATIAVGKAQTQVEVAQSVDVLEAYAGVYRVDDKSTVVVRRDGNHLKAQRSGGDNVEFLPASKSEFYRAGALDRLHFVLDEHGAVKALEFTSSRGLFSVLQRTSLPLPSLPAKVQLSSVALDAMVGDYKLRPDLILNLHRDGERILVRAVGQPDTEFFGSSESELFTLEQDARITLERDKNGRISSLVFHQGSMDYIAERVK